MMTKHSKHLTGTPNKQFRVKHLPDKKFMLVMQETTLHMPLHQRMFSRLIHAHGISTLTEIVGSTVGRPHALLCGGIVSFLLTLSLYLLSKNLGYAMSGAEPILGFCVGWVIGLLYDLLRFVGARIASMLPF